jgi:hypothetical protein
MSTITAVIREAGPVYLGGELLGTGVSYRIERSCGHSANLATLRPPKPGDIDDYMTCHVHELEARYRASVNARRRTRYAARKATHANP